MENPFGTEEERGGHPVIDCDADPSCPEIWEVVVHKRHGHFEFDPSKIELYRTPTRAQAVVIRGIDLEREVEGRQCLNACVLDWLIAHPEYIPESWKKEGCIQFIDTRYAIIGSVHIPYMYWDGHRWSRGLYWHFSEFATEHPVAILADGP